jgi:hypothetical protein
MSVLVNLLLVAFCLRLLPNVAKSLFEAVKLRLGSDLVTGTIVQYDSETRRVVAEFASPDGSRKRFHDQARNVKYESGQSVKIRSANAQWARNHLSEHSSVLTIFVYSVALGCVLLGVVQGASNLTSLFW